MARPKSNRELVKKQGVSFEPAVFKQIEDFAFSCFNANMSAAVNRICKDYFKYMSRRRQTLESMRTEKPTQATDLTAFV